MKTTSGGPFIIHDSNWVRTPPTAMATMAMDMVATDEFGSVGRNMRFTADRTPKRIAEIVQPRDVLSAGVCTKRAIGDRSQQKCQVRRRREKLVTVPQAEQLLE